MVNQLDLNNKDPFLEEFGIKIDPKMTKLMAKKIKGVTLEYKNNFNVVANCGRWDNIGKIFYDPKEIKKWVLIDFSNMLKTDLDNFAQKFVENANKMQLVIENPIKTINIRPIGDIKDLIHVTIQKEIEENVEFLMIINFKKNPVIYNILKQIGDIERGIITQCIDQSAILKWNKVAKKNEFNRNIDQLCSNICLKINCKLGGTNFKISSQDKKLEK